MSYVLRIALIMTLQMPLLAPSSFDSVEKMESAGVLIAWTMESMSQPLLKLCQSCGDPNEDVPPKGQRTTIAWLATSK